MNIAISDAVRQSRKGRKPINGRAMTAAERKQRQRKAAKTKRREMPSWLRLRHDIWRLVQERFMFANATELADALHAVAFAINICSFYAANKQPESYQHVATMLGNREPNEITKSLYQELLPFKPDQRLKEKYPGVYELTVLDVIRDMLGESQNSEGEFDL